MQPINKEIENILINKSYGSLSQSERTIIKTCFESQCEFENAQKILRCSKLLFVNDINQNIPIISNLVFEKAFLANPTINGERIHLTELAQNDGLEFNDFLSWFEDSDLTEPLAIIHFTKFRYNEHN